MDLCSHLALCANTCSGGRGRVGWTAREAMVEGHKPQVTEGLTSVGRDRYRHT